MFILLKKVSDVGIRVPHMLANMLDHLAVVEVETSTVFLHRYHAVSSRLLRIQSCTFLLTKTRFEQALVI